MLHTGQYGGDVGPEPGGGALCTLELAVKGHGVEECAVSLTDVDSGPSQGIGL